MIKGQGCGEERRTDEKKGVEGGSEIGRGEGKG